MSLPKKTLKLMSNLNELGEFKLENNDVEKIKENFFSESLSEKETKSVIQEVYKKQGILVDPHTAVAIGVSKKISAQGNTIILATAHPSKFYDVVMKETNIKPELPESLKYILVEKEQYKKLPKDLKKVKSFILEKV